MLTHLVGRDAYIRTTQSCGKSTVTQHRVWDAQRFLASLQRDAIERSKKDGAEPDTITSATAEEYRAAR